VSPRPGFVLEVDRSTPATLIWHGEGFRLERLPVGSRVVYGPSLSRRSPIRTRPSGTPSTIHSGTPSRCARCSTRACGSRSRSTTSRSPCLPCAPDVRQRVIEAVLDLAADSGVDDVVLIAALALHRRMTDPSSATLWATVCSRHSHRMDCCCSTTPRIPEPDPPRVHRPRRGCGDQPEGRRERPVDLREHQPLRDGWRHKSVATGLASYRSLKHHHNVRSMMNSTRSWTCTIPNCTARIGAWAGLSPSPA